MDNEGHNTQGLGNTPRCKLCNDTGEQRYWEARWRDEKAENERLREALLQIKLKGLTTGYGKTALSRIAHDAINGVHT